GEPSFRALLGRVREGALGAFAHQEVPFEKLVEALAPERSLARTPLFQVLFTLQGADAGALRLGAVQAEPVTPDAAAARFDLALELAEQGDGIGGSLVYRAELWDAETMRRLLDRLRRLLDAAAADAGRPVHGIDLMDEAERRRLLVEWNATAVDDPPDGHVHALVEAQVRRTPDAPALVCGDARLTYAELNARANRIAHRLRGLGIGPELRVGILLERSADLVAAVLGVLKAGGAYVPLDASFPPQRLAWMAADAALAVVVTQRALADAVPPSDARVLVLDADDALAAMPPTDPPPSGTGAEAGIYVLYTSGSTGQPKGVALQHRSVVNFLACMRRLLGMGAGDTLLAITRLGFDISVLELLLPLTAGATVEVADGDTAAEPRLLAARLARGGVTMMQATPATWQALVESGWRPAPEMSILCGGEALPAPLAAKLAAAGAPLWNLYGPTETTVWSAAHRVESADAEGGAVTLGGPIANTAIYVLDGGMRPALPGTPGELCIGGAGLARGYLGRPALTAGRFVPDPFGPVPGARMYRTGDRARFRADGRLEFLGRIDFQVKVRGFRVEPGEIEAVLLRHPSVARAVVAARGADVAARALVAYVVPADGAEVDATELLRAAAEGLPAYMVPSHLVVLPDLPLNANGKVDRAALPAPVVEAAAHVPPRTPAELAAARAWAEVLGVERVGVHDDFFALGGHSLLGTRVVTRLRDALGVEVPLRTLFEASSLAGFAARVEAIVATTAGDAPPIVAVDRHRPLPLSFAQQR
ncbi:MAG TPA: amino acid adenylation domain-containing protein, partial [Longimicrobium sp.]